MRKLVFALASVLTLGALRASAYQLADGTVVWNLTADVYDIRMELPENSTFGTMTLTNRVTGETQLGSLDPALIYDRNSTPGAPDELIAQGIFAPPAVVNISLVDLDGVAFDGAVPVGGGYPYLYLPIDPPPLALFETAIATIPVRVDNPNTGEESIRLITYPISSLPEPGVPMLAASLVAILLLRRAA